jgi:hypothetical protein
MGDTLPSRQPSREASVPCQETSSMDQRMQFIADHQHGLYAMTELCGREGIRRKTSEGARGVTELSHAPDVCTQRIRTTWRCRCRLRDVPTRCGGRRSSCSISSRELAPDVSPHVERSVARSLTRNAASPPASSDTHVFRTVGSAPRPPTGECGWAAGARPELRAGARMRLPAR